MITAIGTILLFVLLIIGLPVALAMALSGAVGLWMVGGISALIGQLIGTPLTALHSYEFIMVPMFILMANFVLVSGVSQELFTIARTWTGRVRGGLGYATVLTGAAFGAICGSSTAAAATLSSTSMPGMIREGYEKKMAAGLVAITGTLSMLIPPSGAMVIYALLAGMNVAQLLIAGIVPGILAAITIMLTIKFLLWLNPEDAPMSQQYTMKEKLGSLRKAWSFILLFVAVTVVIYTGVATPTEASALGALVAFLLAVGRGASVSAIWRALVMTARASCMIGFIILGAHFFGYFLTLTQFTPSLFRFLEASQVNPTVILACLVLMYLVLGCFMDLIAILILTVPIVHPLIIHLGYDPIWFGVITIMLGEIGLLTPPLGLNVFVISKYTGIPLVDAFKGSMPHVVSHLILIILLMMFPQLILWLPGTM